MQGISPVVELDEAEALEPRWLAADRHSNASKATPAPDRCSDGVKVIAMAVGTKVTGW